MKRARVVMENQQLREPLDIFPSCIDAMKETAVHKIRLFQANGKAGLYTL